MPEAKLDEETICTLIHGRALIDKCREDKTFIRSSVQDTNERNDIFAGMVGNRNTDLSKLGFESIDEFQKFNEQMCLEVIAKYRTIIGNCDKCEGYKGTPPCVVLFGKNACFNTGTSVDIKMNSYKMLLDGARAGITITSDNIKAGEYSSPSAFGKQLIHRIKDGKIQFICPERHGYSHSCEVLATDFPFELAWK